MDDKDVKIYKGRGSAWMREDYLDFINYVFGFNGNDNDFPKLLPKLYKEQYDPCQNNYVVTENGKLKAAIGVYPREMAVLDQKLSIHGIGNVAVHPYARSRGYMKDLMHMAIQDMIDAGADMADLGGLRQRYGYFSYEIGAPEYRFDINHTSLRHCFPGDGPLPMEFVPVREEGPLLDNIRALQENQPCHMIRPKEQFLDIVHSWKSELYGILAGERFVGYFVGELGELTLCDMKDFPDVLRNYVAQRGNVTLSLPQYAVEMIEGAHKICGSMHIGSNQNYTIFHYCKVLDAFMKLKAANTQLLDGCFTIQVNGFAGVEKLRISVENGIPSVTLTDQAPQLVLEHKEAFTFFFGLISPAWTQCPLANAWFPLPLYIYSSDHV